MAEFWSLTPADVQHVFAGEADRRFAEHEMGLFHAWQIANWGKGERMPLWQDVRPHRNRVRRAAPTEDSILAKLMQLTALHGGTDNRKKGSNGT